eukprot:6229973-Amphidinium_carterae.1
MKEAIEACRVTCARTRESQVSVCLPPSVVPPFDPLPFAMAQQSQRHHQEPDEHMNINYETNRSKNRNG